MLTGRVPRLGRRRWTATEIAVAGLLAAGLLGATTIASAHVSQGLAFAGAVGLVMSLFLAFNPRIEISLAILALYLGLLDGYLKLSTGNSLATSARDIILYAIVAGALLRLAISSRRVRVPKYTAHVVLLVAVVLAQALNPGTPGMKAAIGGIRQHLEFVPLMFFGYAVMRTERRLKAFFLLLLIIVVANSVVAIVQYNMTPEQLATWGPGYAQSVLGTGAFQGAGRSFAAANGDTLVRPFGLGSDSGVSGVLGWLAIAGALALMASRGGLRRSLCGGAGLVFCVIGIATSQSRSAVVSAVFAVIAFATLSVASRQATRALATLLVGGLIVYGGITAFAEHHRNSASRLGTLQGSSLAQTFNQNRGSAASLTPKYAATYPLGVGLGRAGPAMGFGGSSSGLNAENEPNLLIGELGTLGLVVFASLWLRILFDGVRAVRRTPALAARVYLAALVAALAAMTVVWSAASPTTSVPTAPYFWFVAGIIAWATTSGATAFSPDRPPASTLLTHSST
jgi:hypothetical protein